MCIFISRDRGTLELDLTSYQPVIRRHTLATHSEEVHLGR